jgi:hypothetical protein
MRYEEIIVRIPKEGPVEIEVNGMKGKGCINNTEWLENALGQVQNRQFKREYVEEEHQIINN